jgi:predicted nucleic acid-binding protein
MTDLYVALAERLPLPLLTAGRKLNDRIRHLPNVLWLTDWRPN